jgi:hypothetical protein
LLSDLLLSDFEGLDVGVEEGSDLLDFSDLLEDSAAAGALPLDFSPLELSTLGLSSLLLPLP